MNMGIGKNLDFPNQTIHGFHFGYFVFFGEFYHIF